MHEARIIRDAENIDPGIIRRAVDAAIAAGEDLLAVSVTLPVAGKIDALAALHRQRGYAVSSLLKRTAPGVRKRAHLLEIRLARSPPGPKPKWK